MSITELQTLLDVQKHAEAAVSDSALLKTRRTKIRDLANVNRFAFRFPDIFDENDPEEMVWFTTDHTGGMSSAPRVHLQRFGKNLGILRWEMGRDNKLLPTIVFEPKLPNLLVTAPNVDIRTRWEPSSRPHLVQLRSYLRASITHLRDSAKQRKRPGDPESLECEIQWQIAKQLCAEKRHGGFKAVLNDLRPVMWHGCFHEIGISINREGASKKKGDADLLVRRGRRIDRSYLVFEVKRPNEFRNDEDPKKALYQVLGYATALDIEANDPVKVADPEEDTLEARQRNYRFAFGTKKKDPEGEASPRRFKRAGRLKFGGVVVLHNIPEVCDRLAELKDVVDDYLRGERRVDRVGALLYDYDDTKKCVTGCKWYDGWDGGYMGEPRCALDP